MRTDLPYYLAFCIAGLIAMVVYARWGWKQVIYSEKMIPQERGRLAMNFAVPMGLVFAGCAAFTVYRMVQGF